MRPFQTKTRGDLERSPDTKQRLEAFALVLKQIKGEIEALMARDLSSRILNYDGDASKLAAMKERVNDAMKDLQLETVLATDHGVDVISQDLRLMNQKQDMLAQQQTRQQVLASWQQYMSTPEPHASGVGNDILVNMLGVVNSGSAKKPPCLVGTRTAILGRITQWIEGGSSSKPGFLLLGQAGTGKSSIASSIAEQEKSQRLGAVFHFTRDEQARNEGAILILARQLANWGERRLRSKIASAIESIVQEGLDITLMTPTDQFTQLIQEPLEALSGSSTTLLIVLDALDECSDTYAITLLRLFGTLLAALPNQTKPFVTSRGEPHLQQYFNTQPLKSELETHSMSDKNMRRVEEDIAVYFKLRLPDLVRQWVTESSNWPGEVKRQALVHKTQGLFICATTVARMLADPKSRNPEKQLEDILSSDHNIRPDDMYAQILRRACPIDSDDEVLELFRIVLGTLIVMRVPINIYTLASLLCPDGFRHQEFADHIRVTVLSYLQAVLIIPDVDSSEVVLDAQPIRFIHTSFVNYLTDGSRCDPRFLFNLSKEHEQLAIMCLWRMQELKRNMCDLDDPSLLNSEVEDLEQRVKTMISPGLWYACTKMAVHTSQTPADSEEVHCLVVKFTHTSLMYWLEVLSLMGRVPEAIGMALLIESWLKTGLHLLQCTPPPSYTVPFTHSYNNPVGNTAISRNSSPTVSGAATPGKRAKVKCFFGRLAALAHVPSSTAVTATEKEEPTFAIFHSL
ncbi:hypothetical protein FRB95_006301 [Tulasnella sp. JGI-2019a]|nr:hypothetical protein FRB95_006301 [Tulasnella sp. JGI-2019a]